MSTYAPAGVGKPKFKQVKLLTVEYREKRPCTISKALISKEDLVFQVNIVRAIFWSFIPFHSQ